MHWKGIQTPTTARSRQELSIAFGSVQVKASPKAKSARLRPILKFCGRPEHGRKLAFRALRVNITGSHFVRLRYLPGQVIHLAQVPLTPKMPVMLTPVARSPTTPPTKRRTVHIPV